MRVLIAAALVALCSNCASTAPESGEGEGEGAGGVDAGPHDFACKRFWSCTDGSEQNEDQFQLVSAQRFAEATQKACDGSPVSPLECNGDINDHLACCAECKDEVSLETQSCIEGGTCEGSRGCGFF